MKVIKSFILASSFVGGVNAWNWPSSGSGSNRSGTFNDGVPVGGEIAEDIWKDNGSDCGYVFSFQDDVDDYIDENFPDNGNWQDESYNRGVRAGADQVVQKYEKMCLENTSDECNDLGVAAAQEIAFGFCPFNAESSFARPNYKERCRLVAVGICEGNVGKQVEKNGCGISSGELQKLQDKCEDQVNEMVGGPFQDDDRFDMVNTPKPTKKPSSRHYVVIVNIDMVMLLIPNILTGQPAGPLHARQGDLLEGHLRVQPRDPQDDVIELAAVISPTKRPTRRPTSRPSSRPTRRPTARPTDETRAGTYREGFGKGEDKAEQIWRSNGSDCGFIFSFEDEVDDFLQIKCSDDTPYCRGMDAGAGSVVLKYEKICLQDSPDECIALGQAAAQEIAFEYCPFDASSSFARPDYKETCREVATGICEGAVGGQVKDNGCSISDNNLARLQKKCENQVNSMTGGDTSSSGWDGQNEPVMEPYDDDFNATKPVVFNPRNSGW
ncbi:hypothetical protein ACHAXN_001657 [Cyclotella atomus]